MNKILSYLKFLFVLAIGITLLWLAFRDQDIDKMLLDFKNANYIWVILSVLFGLLSHIVRAARWNMLINPLGFKPPLFNTFLAVMVGYLANLAIPRLGEVSRCGVLKRIEKIPMNSLLGTVIAERAIDLLTLVILLIAVILLQFDLINEFFMNQVFLPSLNNAKHTASGLQTFFIIAVSGICFFIVLIYVYRKKLLQFTFILKLREIFIGFLKGIQSVRYMKNNVLFIVYSICIWTLYFLMTYVCFSSLESTSHLELFTGIFVLTMGSVGMTMPVQGGIGTFHWAVSQSLVLYGISGSDGLLFATILHTSQIIFILVGGGAALLIVLIKERKLSLQKEDIKIK